MNRSNLTWMVASLAIHGFFAWLASGLEPPLPKPTPEKDPLAQVRIQNQDVELPKPPPPVIEEKKVEPPPEPPKPEVKKEAPKPKPKPKKKKKTKKRVKKKKPQPAQKPNPPQPSAPPPAPAPLVLSNVSLGGGIAVTQGDDDVFGDPDESRKGTPVPKNPNPLPTDAQEEDDGPLRKVVVTPPKPLSSNPKQVPWPSDIPNSKEKFRVKLSLRINPQGGVSKVKVVSGRGEPFDSAARKFARKLRFKPATRDGKPISYSVPWELCWNCSG